MNKKTLLIIAIASLTISSIIYIKTRPEPVSMCDSLMWKMAEAKTQAEYNYADKQWQLVCLNPTEK